MLASEIVYKLLEDDIDPKEEVQRQLDWKSLLVEFGFKPTKCAAHCEAMRREFPGHYALIVIGEKSDLQGMVEVQFYSGKPGNRICDARQNVTPENLVGLVKNYLKWLE